MNLPALKEKHWMLIFAGTAAATFGLGYIASSIMERRVENLRPTQVMVTPINEWETDPAVWGRNFPREYDTWKRTLEKGEKTRYGGSDPFSKLDQDPRLKELFAGYGFALEYNEERGHGYAMEDVEKIKRINEKSPATCYTCKSPSVPKLMKEMGVKEFYASNFLAMKASGKMAHSISCLDCHDPKTMDLRISRPAFVEAMAERGIDVNKATHQEMRSYVCGQCHVEYYFRNEPAEGKKDYLTFPWKKGLNIDNIINYYNEYGFKDWEHPVSGTPTLKMQHPEFEMWNQGIHAYRKVACADCHMPYKSEGGVKVTSHHVKSPLLGDGIKQSCVVCHRWTEAEVKQRVESIQDTTRQLMDRAQDAIIAAHKAVGEAAKAGVSVEKLKAARQLIRDAQARWDFVAAENSMGFHAPQECARILALAMDGARQAENLAQGEKWANIS